MIIKVELTIEWTDAAEQEYPDGNRCGTILAEIKSALEFDKLFIVKSAEAYETNHEPTN